MACLNEGAVGETMFVSASPLEYLFAYALVVLFGMAVGFLLGRRGLLGCYTVKPFSRISAQFSPREIFGGSYGAL